MTISNRVLWIVAGLSALAVLALTWRSPLAKTVQVLRANVSLERDDVVSLVENTNVVSESVSVAAFADAAATGKPMMPRSVLPVLGRVAVVREVNYGDFLRVQDFAPTLTRQPAEGDEAVSYVHLSGLLTNPDTKAVALQVNELGSFDFTLEPEDRIDIVYPGGIHFIGVRVLAVGARTAKGWAGAGRRVEEFSTVTLAFQAAEAEKFAKVIAEAPSARPVVLLHPAAP